MFCVVGCYDDKPPKPVILEENFKCSEEELKRVQRETEWYKNNVATWRSQVVAYYNYAMRKNCSKIKENKK